MRRRHLSKLWLMTDERMGEAMWDALARLPRGGGVVFRHYATPAKERRRLFARILRIARRRRLVVVRAGTKSMRGENGVHNGARRSRGLRTYAVHNVPEAVAARRAGAGLVLVSPVFATRSHADSKGLGVARLGLLLRQVRTPSIALGGMNAKSFKRLHGLGLLGWAGIDVWNGPAVAKPRRQS